MKKEKKAIFANDHLSDGSQRKEWFKFLARSLSDDQLSIQRAARAELQSDEAKSLELSANAPSLLRQSRSRSEALQIALAGQHGNDSYWIEDTVLYYRRDIQDYILKELKNVERDWHKQPRPAYALYLGEAAALVKDAEAIKIFKKLPIDVSDMATAVARKRVLNIVDNPYGRSPLRYQRYQKSCHPLLALLGLPFRSLPTAALTIAPLAAAVLAPPLEKAVEEIEFTRLEEEAQRDLTVMSSSEREALLGQMGPYVRKRLQNFRDMAKSDRYIGEVLRRVYRGNEARRESILSKFKELKKTGYQPQTEWELSKRLEAGHFLYDLRSASDLVDVLSGTPRQVDLLRLYYE